MVFFCLPQFHSLFFKKYNISLQVGPAARAPRCVARGSCCPQRAQAAEGQRWGHIPQWTALVPSAAAVGSPGLGVAVRGVPWARLPALTTGCGQAGRADRPGLPALTSGCGLG